MTRVSGIEKMIKALSAHVDALLFTPLREVVEWAERRNARAAKLMAITTLSRTAADGALRQAGLLAEGSPDLSAEQAETLFVDEIAAGKSIEEALQSVFDRAYPRRRR